MDIILNDVDKLEKHINDFMTTNPYIVRVDVKPVIHITSYVNDRHDSVYERETQLAFLLDKLGSNIFLEFNTVKVD
jgi:hypothetical protein